MSILNFVTQEQLDDLDDDPRTAFMELVNFAQRSLNDQVNHYSSQDEDGWRSIEALRHSFVNVVVASAKRFEIEPFSSMEVPRIRKNLDYEQFKADLDHYITQLVLDNSAKSKRDSVIILPDSKEKIRTYVRELRGCIEKSNMKESKREALLKRLDELEKELDKRRTSTIAVAKLVYDILAVPGTMWASYEISQKLASNISQQVAISVDAEKTSKPLVEARTVPALSPPRKALGFNSGRGGFADDLDEDVPF